MKYDELAFFNQQLAAMLRDGLPLEAALKELSSGMADRTLRTEIEALQQDLKEGTSFREALSRRKLPPFYVRMLEIGSRSNDLPAMLTLLADYYRRNNLLWTRLKGLMVYPLLVVLVGLGLTIMLSFLINHFLANLFSQMISAYNSDATLLVLALWMPPILLGLIGLLLFFAISRPAWRARLRWRLPGFREASLAQLSSAMGLMLKNGLSLTEALALAQMLEGQSPAAPVLGDWRAQVERGQGKPAQWTGPARPFPPLFLWLVQQAGEDPAAGFQKAADLYHDRAAYRIEMALYGALPISILLLGQMVLWQVGPLMRAFLAFMNFLGDVGGGSS
jgi:type IV pilus assembly protein PilC